MTPEPDAASVEPVLTALPAPAPPPRIWTVFAVYGCAFAGTIAVQVPAAIALALWLIANGTEPKQLQTALVDLLTTPAVFMLFAGLSQLVIGLSAIIPARLSPQPTLHRLRLVKPDLPAWGFPVVAVGALLPTAVGVALAYALAEVLPPDETVERLYEQMTWPLAVPFILFIALAPGFFEEMLFRGYIQGRLLERWPPWAAILVTSALFALMHFEPHAVVFAFPIGVWLGVVAWRTGSVWPTILCHALINGLWNIWNVGQRLAGLPETPPTPVAVALGTLILVCFVLSCWLLARARPRMAAEESAGKASWGADKSGDESDPWAGPPLSN
jgi:uncharacterized protein